MIHASRHRGFRHVILEELEHRAARLGYDQLHLDTTTSQRAAQAFYRVHGYRESGRGRLGDFDVIFFEKRPMR